MLRDFKTILVSKCWKCWIQGHSQLRLGVGGGAEEGKTGQHRATSLWEEGLGQRASRPPGTPRLGGAGGQGPAGRAWGGKEAEEGRPLLQPGSGEVGRRRGRLPGPSPYLGAVVATFSPAEWQLVPLGCRLAEPRGRPQATGQRVWEDSKGLQRVRDPPWDPGAPQHTHTQGRVGDISQGTRSFPLLHGESQPLLRRLTVLQTPTPRKSPLSSQGTRMSLPPLPQAPGKVSPKEGRSGQAGGGALEARPWHPAEEIPGGNSRLPSGRPECPAADPALWLSSPRPFAPSLWLPGPPTGSSPGSGS